MFSGKCVHGLKVCHSGRLYGGQEIIGDFLNELDVCLRHFLLGHGDHLFQKGLPFLDVLSVLWRLLWLGNDGALLGLL